MDCPQGLYGRGSACQVLERPLGYDGTEVLLRENSRAGDALITVADTKCEKTLAAHVHVAVDCYTIQHELCTSYPGALILLQLFHVPFSHEVDSTCAC